MAKKTDLTQGSILKRLLIFSLPMIAGNMLQQLYNITDTLIVGRFIGSDALAAVGSTYTLMTFLTSLIIGLCMGSGALFSKWTGAGLKDEVRTDVFHSLVFIGSAAVLIVLIVFPGTDRILTLLSIPDDIYSLVRGYARIVFCGILFVFLFNFSAYLLRALGNSTVPLWFLMASSVMNIVLDVLFVIRYGLGVNGTAVATVISQAFSAIGIAAYALTKEKYYFRFRHVKLSRTRMASVVRNDLMTGLQQSVMNFGVLMIQGLVNSFGTAIIAAFAAAVKIDTLAYMPAQEFSNAYSLFIAQNHGAEKQGRIKDGTKSAVAISSLFCISISMIVFVFAKQLMTVFVDAGETEIIMHGIKYLHIEGSFYIGIGCLFLLYAYYRGIEKPGMSLILTIISLGTRVLLSYALAPNTALGVTAIWWSIPIGWFLADVTGFSVMRKLNTTQK